MKRSLQEYVELVVFGLIALLVGTGLLWLVGWVLSLGGIVLKGLAGLLWMLLRFIVPVAIAGGLVYFLVKAAQDKQKPAAAGAGSGSTGSRSTGPSSTAAGSTAVGGGVIDGAMAGGALSAAQSAPDTVGEAVGGVVDAVGSTVAEDVDDLGATVDSSGADAGAEYEDVVTPVADDAADYASGDASDILVSEDDEDEHKA